MPEGDTIHKLARRLHPLLDGRVVKRLALRERGDVGALAGSSVSEVSAIGKHLILRLRTPNLPAEHAAPFWTLRVHLGMHGRVRHYAAGTEPARAHLAAPVALWTAEFCVVFYRAGQVELRPGAAPRSLVIRALGPDLLAPDVDLATVAARARRLGTRRVAETLLDQRVACGIGNVYRSEVLFLCGVHPDAAVGELDDAALTELYRVARDLLRENLGPGPRNTLGAGLRSAAGQQLWVYGRRGEPCRRCAQPIQMKRIGDQVRSVYFCACCQPAV